MLSLYDFHYQPHTPKLHLRAPGTLHGCAKVPSCQPEPAAAWGKLRGRNPTKSGPQTTSCGQPVVQGWLDLLQAPWEHWHPSVETHCPQTGPGIPQGGYFSQLQDARPSSPANVPSSFGVRGQAPWLHHAHCNVGQRRSSLPGACKTPPEAMVARDMLEVI